MDCAKSRHFYCHARVFEQWKEDKDELSDFTHMIFL